MKNSHLSLLGHTRHTRHAGDASTKPQVNGPAHRPFRHPATVVAIATLIASCASGVAAPTSSPSGSVAPLPFRLPAQAELKASQKKVFVHYLPTFPISLDNKAPQLDYYDFTAATARRVVRSEPA